MYGDGDGSHQENLRKKQGAFLLQVKWSPQPKHQPPASFNQLFYLLWKPNYHNLFRLIAILSAR